MDYLLPELETAVEVKKTRPTLTARDVGEELIVDIKKYQEHPRCRKLVCFVYDPDGFISNPRGVEADLSKQHDKLAVRVMIRPR
jgi:REase_DpnII-MboI